MLKMEIKHGWQNASKPNYCLAAACRVFAVLDTGIQHRENKNAFMPSDHLKAIVDDLIG